MEPYRFDIQKSDIEKHEEAQQEFLKSITPAANTRPLGFLPPEPKITLDAKPKNWEDKKRARKKMQKASKRRNRR